MAHVESVNLARAGADPDPRARGRSTGIDKAPTDAVTMVRPPGTTGSGLVGDTIGNTKVHGGDDQAVYAYAREDLDHWETELGRGISNGMFGENITTAGIDVTRARIGERWQIGDDGLLLEVSAPRTPCRTFAAFLAADQWIKTFTAAAKPGAYLRVINSGPVRAGDAIVIRHRPDHDVTIELAFRARMSEPDLLPRLLAAEALSADLKAYASRNAIPGS
ncbi:MAG: MOSC domain-containing protein [Mycobacterium sp.]